MSPRTRREDTQAGNIEPGCVCAPRPRLKFIGKSVRAHIQIRERQDPVDGAALASSCDLLQVETEDASPDE